MLALVVLMLGTTAHGAGIDGPDTAQEGSIALISADISADSRFKWVLPEGTEISLRSHDGTQIAIVPQSEPAIEIILVVVDDASIDLFRHTVYVSDDPVLEKRRVSGKSPQPKRPAPEVKRPSRPKPPPTQPDPPATKPAPAPVPEVSLVMYSMTGCEPCAKWMASERPKLPSSIKFERLIDTPGINAFPSFKLTGYGREIFFTGYLTADQVKSQFDQMRRNPPK